MRSVSLVASALLALSQWAPLFRGSATRVFSGWLGRVGSWVVGWTRASAAVARLKILPAGLGLIGAAILPALAYASPPDPAWIQGLYDDADYDDVVAMATSGCGSTATGALADCAPTPHLLETLLLSDEWPTLDRRATAVQPRGPPAP